jgi:hypothetical protein
LRVFGITVDFHHIVSSDFGFCNLRDFAIDVATFEERLVIDRSDRVLTEISRRREDLALAVVKSVFLSPLLTLRQIETEIENLFNLRHSLIAPLVGFAFPVESDGRRELKTVRLHGI